MINLDELMGRIGINIPMSFDKSMSVIEYLGVITKYLEELEKKYNELSYVPILRGEWADHYTYKRFSLVTHNGDSYISIQDVPQTIQIDNVKYWLKISSFNAQLDSKLGVFVSETLPEIETRDKYTFYLKITEKQTLGTFSCISMKKV